MHIIVVFVWPLCELGNTKCFYLVLCNWFKIKPNVVLEYQVFYCDFVCYLLTKNRVYWYVSEHRFFDGTSLLVVIFWLESNLVSKCNYKLAPQPGHNLIIRFATAIIRALDKLDFETLCNVRIVITLNLNSLVYALELVSEVFNISPRTFVDLPKVSLGALLCQTKFLIRARMSFQLILLLADDTITPWPIFCLNNPIRRVFSDGLISIIGNYGKCDLESIIAREHFRTVEIVLFFSLVECCFIKVDKCAAFKHGLKYQSHHQQCSETTP